MHFDDVADAPWGSRCRRLVLSAVPSGVSHGLIETNVWSVSLVEGLCSPSPPHLLRVVRIFSVTERELCTTCVRDIGTTLY